MQIRLFSAPLIALATITAHSAYADPKDASNKTLDAISECRKIAADAARLACFDRFAQSFETAVKSEEIKIVDRNDVKQIKKSLFGFVLPRVDLFGGKDSFTEINTVVTSSSAVANDRMRISVAEGDAVWQTTDPIAFAPKSGSKIRIRKGALGNYFLFIDGKSYRGNRVK